MTYRTVSTNPFGRFDRIRQCLVGAERTGCSTCGRLARFRYGISRHDRPVPVWEPGRFCSVGCYRDYHS